MAGFSYKLKENTDLCHFCLPTEKEYGVQCIIIRENNDCRDMTLQHLPVVKTLLESRPLSVPKDLAFIHIALPNSNFNSFDNEKYKIIIPASAYFKLLDFFQTDWPFVQNRLESDFQDVKSSQEWIAIDATCISFRGPADIMYRMPLDMTNSFALDLVAIKRMDTGKCMLSLVYSDSTLGCLSLPPQPMLQLAKRSAYLKSLYEEPVVAAAAAAAIGGLKKKRVL